MGPYVSIRTLMNEFLESINKPWKEVQNLKSLDCSKNLLPSKQNPLTRLPAEIGQLRELIDLSCEGNLIPQLPEEIGQLRELKFLNCSENRISGLCPEIGQLRELTELSCQLNSIPEFPRENSFG